MTLKSIVDCSLSAMVRGFFIVRNVSSTAYRYQNDDRASPAKTLLSFAYGITFPSTKIARLFGPAVDV